MKIETLQNSIKKNSFGSKYINVPAAEVHLAEGRFFLEEQILNKSKSLMYRAGTRRPTVSKREGQNLE
jgi:hypothetical protein